MAPVVAVARVLVVDDNAENRAACRVVSNGADALALVETERFDCILLDIRMPGMDGIEVCTRLRARPDGARFAILFLTAERDVSTFDRALAAGGDDFVTKPFRPGELVARIQTAVRLRELVAANDGRLLELRQQRDVLHRVQLEKEQLTQFLVHDFKNPVNAIQLQAQRVSRSATDPRAIDAAEKITTEVRMLMRMITDLLDLGRADEGRLVAARAPVDVRELVATTLEELRPRALAAQVELESAIGLEAAELDRDLILRVLANLVDNALRHAPEKSKVTITSRASEHGIELRVADQGAGVPEDLRAHVFDRYVTQSSSRTSRGLGLAFCRVAVEAHGGRIWIEDAAPGAVFALEIPNAKSVRS